MFSTGPTRIPFDCKLDKKKVYLLAFQIKSESGLWIGQHRFSSVKPM